ncbi:hypothetical protein FJ960_23885 [Mesorhizobium sp. B2-3-11]|uniref:hypothetical protein n=1 Tax=Mesorhizobium sp. B2-3-11 TaxID=2589953 RepID=UPI0011295F56|nr:hypothetical protein [Mesorhizobium sp. B2-3-11]TPL97779.1 hypothetical protein FJ960_23885 [Mesorhizobium sp. B2-3-11]
MKYLEIIDDAVGLGDVGDASSLNDRLLTLTPEKLFELVEAVKSSLPKPVSQASPYCFVGNTEMSGLPYPCSSFQCRDNAFGTAASFAAMYADEFVLFNPFFGGMENKRPSSGSIREISYYLTKLLSVHPLVERKIITFTDFSTYNLCRSCFNRGLSGFFSESTDIKDMYFIITNKFLEEAQVTFDRKIGGALEFSIRNSADYVGHFNGGFHYSGDKFPASMKGIEKDQILTKEQVIEIGAATGPATFLSNDIIQTNKTASEFNINNISTTTKQIEIMKEVFGSGGFSKNIDLNYPFIAQNDIRDILKFRDSEWHHLHDFRKLIGDGVKSGDDVTLLFKDEEAKMEKIVQKNRRSQNRNLIDGGGKAAFHAVAAAATGGISAILGAVVAAFGGKHITDTLIPAIRERLQEPEELRDSKIYYAWKLKKKINRH